MDDKNYIKDTQNEYTGKNPLSKHENEFYHDDDNVVMPIIRVKRISGAAREKWKIFDDAKEALIIEGNKITKKEKEFLRSPEGISFLLTQYKSGVKTFSRMHSELKKSLK